MQEDTDQNPVREHSTAKDADDDMPVTTVAGAVLGAFFDELERSEDLKEKAAELRVLVLSDGIMAEPAISAILFPEAS